MSKYVTPSHFGFYLIEDPEKNKKIALLALPNHEKGIKVSTFFYQECMAFESAHIFLQYFLVSKCYTMTFPLKCYSVPPSFIFIAKAIYNIEFSRQ